MRTQLVQTCTAIVLATIVAAGTCYAQAPEPVAPAGPAGTVYDIPPIEPSGRYAPVPGDIVLDIEIRTLAGVSVADVRKLLEVRRGAPLSSTAIRKSIKLLYLTGQYSDIAAYTVRKRGGVVVVFELRARKRIDDIDIRGNPTISDLDVLRAMKVDRRDEFLPGTVPDMEKAVLELHHKAGFRQAKVTISAIQLPFTIRYLLGVRVVEGQPTRVGQILFTGNTHFPAAYLLHELGISVGDRFDKVRVEKALDGLREFYHEKGFPFAVINKKQIAEKIDPAANTVVLTIPVDCGQRTTFLFAGNVRVPTSELRAVVKRAIADRDTGDLKYLAARLRDHYVSRGFAGAKVAHRAVVDDETGEATVTFRSVEGPQILVQEIRFAGNDGIPAAKLEEFVETFVAEARPVDSIFERARTEAVEAGLAEERRAYLKKTRYTPSYEDDQLLVFVEDPYDKAAQALEEYYKSLGWLDCKVAKTGYAYAKDNSRVTVTYKIKEGVRTFFKGVSFKGNKGLSTFFLIFKVRSMLGPHLDLYKVEEARLKIQGLYAEEGFIYAAVEEKIKYSDDRTRAEVAYEIDEGAQVRVGRMVLQGNDNTDDTVVLDNVPLSTGGLYRPSRAAEGQASLLRLQVFQGASVALLDPDEMEAQKDLGVFLRERDPRSIEVAAGISTQDGARVALEYGHLNLFGKALELSTRLKLGYQVFAYLPGYLDAAVAEEFKDLKFTDAVAREAGVGLNLPKIYGLPLAAALRFDLVNERVNERVYSMDRIAATPGLELKLIDPLTLLLAYSVEYKFFQKSNAAVSETSLTAAEQQLLKTPQGLQWLGSARPTLALDMRDDKFNPHKGFMVSVGFEYTRSLATPKSVTGYIFDPSTHRVTSQFSFDDFMVNFIKLSGTATLYIPTSRKTTLALQIGGGDIMTLGDNGVPTPDAFFYMGGRSTLRGFSEKAVFAADLADDQKLDSKGGVALSPGGNVYILYKAEFRFPLSGGFDGGIFVDAGNIWVDPGNFSPWRLRPCAGFGIRYKTPVGPLSLDFAINLLPDSSISEAAGAWQFSVGMF